MKTTLQNPSQELLKRIEAHCYEHGVAETTFGVRAMNDPNLVRDLRQGRDLRFSTIEKILQHLEAQEAERAAS